MFTLPRSMTKAAAIAVLLGSSVASMSTFAAAPDDTNPRSNDMPTSSVDMTPGSSDMSASSSTDTATTTSTTSSTPMKGDPAMKMQKHVEVRIKTLHDELKITPDQEAQWSTVAATMRDNEQSMSSLVEARHNNSGTMTAIDDVKSYQAIAQSHADGLAKFVTAFEPLYNSMNDQQKKTADSFFSKSQMHDHKHGHMMKKTSTTSSTTMSK